MSNSRWIQIEAGRKENTSAAMVAGTLAVGVGVVTFYFARMFLARERVDGHDTSGSVTIARRDGEDPGE